MTGVDGGSVSDGVILGNVERGQGTNFNFGCLHWNSLIHAWISGDCSSLVRAENFRTCADTLSRLRSPNRSTIHDGN